MFKLQSFVQVLVVPVVKFDVIDSCQCLEFTIIWAAELRFSGWNNV